MISSLTNKRGFTLIELLTVIAIMGLIVAIAIPSVERLMKSGGLSAASREVSNTLGLARQYAITHRTKTRVVFAHPLTIGSIDPSTYLNYVAYTVVVSDTTNTALFFPWDYIGKWDFLPTGTIFLNQTPGGTFGGGYDLDNGNSILNQDPVGGPSFALPFPNPALGNFVACAYIEFGPTGADTRSDGNPDQITLTEGFIQPPSANSLPFRTSANYVNISVDSIVGRVKISRPQ